MNISSSLNILFETSKIIQCLYLLINFDKIQNLFGIIIVKKKLLALSIMYSFCKSQHFNKKEIIRFIQKVLRIKGF